MKATEAQLLSFLNKAPQFVIPIFQRTYSWTDKECQQLWDDIMRTGKRDDISAHFVGSIVYIEKGLYHVTARTPLLVIDGQQRLTTISILLEVLARHLGSSEPVEGFSAKKVRNYYLLNDVEEGEKRFRLLLTQTDKESLLALMQQRAWPKDHSLRVKTNYEFFDEQVKALGGDFTALCKGLAKLVIVDVSLNRDQDNPQLIFESMNSTGRELSQADLIRNFILMGLELDHQTRLYEEHWRPIEIEFGQEAYGDYFDGFMRHYLTLKTGEIPNISAVYEAFKAYSRRTDITAQGVDALVADIHTFASYYCAMAFDKEKDKKLKEAFSDLRELRVDVAYPFLLELYHDFKSDSLSQEDFLATVRLVEAYVFRRAICAIPTNSLNKTFANFSKALQKDNYLESIKAAFLVIPLKSYRRFPDDDEFSRNLQTRDIYTIRLRSYWLRKLENEGRKERVSIEEFTIEHIMPQNPDLSPAWKHDLGLDWERIHNTYLHTLGNLTLTAYNSSYSDRPFAEKRDLPEKGLSVSPLKLNQGLGQVEKWDETAIRARAGRLAELAVRVWQTPKLDEETLAKYRPSTAAGRYTINDHPQLSSSPLRELFQAFQREVMALDPAVTVEYLKYYVAFKAETNFVDVVPQAKRLRLSLNMPFSDIRDPLGICRDVTEVGRWGNGDVEVRLSSLSDLQYVLGLVRQALDRQLGNGVEE